MKLPEVKIVKCRRCLRKLCERMPVSIGEDKAWVVHIIHKGLEFYAYDITLFCPSCRSGYRITGDDGIIESMEQKYADKRSR